VHRAGSGEAPHADEGGHIMGGRKKRTGDEGKKKKSRWLERVVDGVKLAKRWWQDVWMVGSSLRRRLFLFRDSRGCHWPRVLSVPSALAILSVAWLNARRAKAQCFSLSSSAFPRPSKPTSCSPLLLTSRLYEHRRRLDLRGVFPAVVPRGRPFWTAQHPLSAHSQLTLTSLSTHLRQR
jgi:hypothetical protein